MKKKNFITKHFGKIGLLFGFAFVLGCGVMSLHVQDNVQPQVNEVSNIQKNRQLISYDGSTYTITYDLTDLTNGDVFDSVYQVLRDNDYGSGTSEALAVSNSYITYTDGVNSTTYTFNISSFGQYFNGSKNICFNISNGGSSGNYITWRYVDSDLVFQDANNQIVNVQSVTIVSETYYNLVAPEPPSDDFGAVVSDFLEILVGGIIDLGTGIASGVASMASALFLNVDTSTGNVTGLSTFGGILAIFAGLALAVGITTKVYEWVTSLGN